MGEHRYKGCFAQKPSMILGVPSPFFPGILLSRKPPKTKGKLLVFEKNDGWTEWTRNQPLEKLVSFHFEGSVELVSPIFDGF